MKKFLLTSLMVVFIVACGGGGSTDTTPEEVTETTPPLKLVVPEERVYVDQDEVELRMKFVGASRAESFCVEIPESWIKNENPDEDANIENNVCAPFEIDENGRKIYDKHDKGILNIRAYYEDGEIILVMKVDLVRRSGKFPEELTIWFKEKDSSLSQRRLLFQSNWVVPIFIEVYRNDPRPIYGCTDESATNYDTEATENDGSCIYPIVNVLGCTDPEALNYNPSAIKDDGSCVYPPPPCANGFVEDPCTNLEGTLNGVLLGTCNITGSGVISISSTVSMPVSGGYTPGNVVGSNISTSFFGSVSTDGSFSAHDWIDYPVIPRIRKRDFIIDGFIFGDGILSGLGTWTWVVFDLSGLVIKDCSGTWASN